MYSNNKDHNCNNSNEHLQYLLSEFKELGIDYRSSQYHNT